MHPKYRSDIDGLRAVAVLSVLLYHYGVTWIPGGFAGVDIFFVISGYLISQIVISEVRRGSFSFGEFYARRVRRILPAFLVVSALTLLAGYVILTPFELVGLSWSLIASILLSGNIYFYEHSGYFDAGSSELPLLHFWSLGIEEQFYLIFPAAVLAIQRLRPKLLGPAIAVIAMISLIACQIVLRPDPSASFYLLPFRAWELLAGAGVFLASKYVGQSDRLALALSASGLLFIGFSVFRLTHETHFPGLAAVPVCTGSALFILSGVAGKSIFQSILGAAPLRLIGKISYSLYLVHWPILIFAARLFPDSASVTRNSMAAAGSFAFAIAMYICIETPFRRFRWLQVRRIALASAVASAAAFITIGVIVLHNDGFKGRLSTEAEHISGYLHYTDAEQYETGTCYLKTSYQSFEDLKPECFPPAGKKRVMIWGDSAMAQYAASLKAHFADLGYAMGNASLSGCPPLLGYESQGRPQCIDFNEKVLRALIGMRPDFVLLAAAWPNGDGALYPFLGPVLAKLNEAGLNVIVLGELPVFKRPVPIILADRLWYGDKRTFATADEFNVGAGTIEKVDAEIQRIVAPYPHVKHIEIFSAICPQRNCELIEQGTPLYSDLFHATALGAQIHVRRFFPKIAEAIEHSGLVATQD